MKRCLQWISRHPEWPLAAAMLTLPFDTWKFGPADLLSPSNIAFVLAGLALLPSLREPATWRRRVRWAIAIVLVFILSFLPSAILSADRAQAARTFVSIVGTGAIFGAVVLASRDRASTRLVLVGWLIGGLIAAAAAIAEYALWLAGIHVGTGGIAGLCGTSIIVLRAEGFSGSANYLSFFMLPVAVASFGLIGDRSRAARVGVVAAIACSLTVLLAYSRGSLGALVLAAFIGMLLFIFGRTRRLLPRVAAVGVALVALLLFARLLVGFNQASLVARLNIVESALQSIGASPISGSGLGSGVPLSNDVVGFCENVVVLSEQREVVGTSAPTTLPTTRPTQIATTAPTTGLGGVPTTGPILLSTTAPTTGPTSRPTSAATSVPVAVATSRPVSPTSTVAPPDVIARRDTHVTVLQAAYTAGVLGLLGYGALVLGTLWYGTRNWSTRSRIRTALVVSAIVAQVAGFATDALSIKQLYVGLALLWAVAAVESALPTARPKDDDGAVLG